MIAGFIIRTIPLAKRCEASNAVARPFPQRARTGALEEIVANDMFNDLVEAFPLRRKRRDDAHFWKHEFLAGQGAAAMFGSTRAHADEQPLSQLDSKGIK